MRYTFGSLLFYFTGGNLTYVAEQMGHSSIDTLAETHARTVKETKKEQRLDRQEVFAQILAVHRSVPAPEETAQPVRA
jgi:integrase